MTIETKTLYIYEGYNDFKSPVQQLLTKFEAKQFENMKSDDEWYVLLMNIKSVIHKQMTEIRENLCITIIDDKKKEYKILTTLGEKVAFIVPVEHQIMKKITSTVHGYY